MELVAESMLYILCRVGVLDRFDMGFLGCKLATMIPNRGFFDMGILGHKLVTMIPTEHVI